MNNSFSRDDLGSIKLQSIREGMPVYDPQHNKIGEVETVYLGSVSESDSDLGQGPQTTGSSAAPMGRDDIEGFPPVDRNANVQSFAFGGATSLTDFEADNPLKNRLLREGFIRINLDGLFSGNRYALPEMVSSVSPEGVYLNRSGEDLIQPND